MSTPHPESRLPEAGIERDRILDRALELLAAGKVAEADALRSAHPELEEALASNARVLRLLQGAAGPHRSSTVEGGAIGRFEIVRELGRGGMGRVLLAFDPVLRRDVAIKLLLLPTAAGPEEQRFRREAQLLAKLHHPHIVALHEVGETSDGLPFLVMEYVEGASLAELLLPLVDVPPAARDARHLRPRSKAPAKEAGPRGSFVLAAVRLFATLADALALAHEQGIVHRDLKPANILVDVAGEPRLVDFGVAQWAASAALTRTGAVLGTLPYMSPEQLDARWGEVGPAADVYALGASLYETLTLVTPVTGRSSAEVHQRALHSEPVPLRKRNALIPRDLETIVLKTLEKRAERRYPTARELAKDLRNLLELRPIQARRASPWRRAQRFAQRNPWRAVALGVLGAAVLAVLLWPLYRELARARSRESFARALQHLERLDFSSAEAELSHAIRADAENPEAQRLHRDLPRLRGVRDGSLTTYAVDRAILELAATPLDSTPWESTYVEIYERVQRSLLSRANLLEDPAKILLALGELRARRLATLTPSPPSRGPRSVVRIEGSPSGSKVFLFRYVEAGGGAESAPVTLAARPCARDGSLLPQELRDQTLAPIGELPIEPLELESGSYLFVFRHADCEELLLPLLVGGPAGEAELNAGCALAHLLPLNTTPQGFCYVAPGPFLTGGDPDATPPRSVQWRWLDGFWIGQHEVTVAEYLEFLNDPEVSREVEELSTRGGVHRVPRSLVVDDPVWPISKAKWHRGASGNYETDWPLRQPIHDISCEDAFAYCEWRTRCADRRGAGWIYRLPSGDEWEKAARGADGRHFPWGNQFDARLCMNDQRNLLVGAFASDRSPYGVLGMCGLTLEWCAGNVLPHLCSWRGGVWAMNMPSSGVHPMFRAASQNPGQSWRPGENDGFRMVAWHRPR